MKKNLLVQCNNSRTMGGGGGRRLCNEWRVSKLKTREGDMQMLSGLGSWCSGNVEGEEM